MVLSTDQPGRVPVEHRVLGMDRRTFAPAVVVLAVYVLWAWVVPRIDQAVPYEDPVEAGDVLQVTPEVVMVPPVGWELRSGLLTSDRTRGGETSADAVLLVGDGVSVLAKPGPFRGTPAQLLDQVGLITSTESAKQGFAVVGRRENLTTASGLQGVEQGFQSSRNVGLTAAFVADEGIEIQVVGSPAQMTAEAGAIEAMLRSLTYTAGVSR